MARYVQTNARTFVAAADLTAVSNKTEFNAMCETVDVTNYGSAGVKEFLPGLVESELMVAGFWDAGTGVLSDTDPALQAAIGAVVPWSVAPVGAADQALAWVSSAVSSSYKLLGAVGDAAPFEFTAKGTVRPSRGVVGHPPGTARTASGTGTANQLGAVTAAQRLYANLHVLSVSGTTPSLTARIESDNAVGFPSPVTVATFTAATAVGGQHLSVAGPTTDDWFRVAWTITGTTPSFLFFLSMARA